MAYRTSDREAWHSCVDRRLLDAPLILLATEVSGKGDKQGWLPVIHNPV